ncbi:MAG: DNA polymerase III subunit delta' [Alphaproteobacteria bacterium]|nr:DNA polymerase III subunit delta' [Alphaproteobacteria bacterium]
MSERIPPAENHFLIGHEAEEKIFLSAYNNRTLHHGWLITGDEGIGKATLAYRIARFLLCAEEGKKYETLEISPQNPVFAQVAQHSHPDFKVLERDFIETDKKKLIKAINAGEEVDDDLKQGLKRSAVIKVEDVREVVAFLMKKSFNDNWRVVIVDATDDLNASSANALLKILEEPPLKSILLLVVHNAGKVLPTIRSRCAQLNLSSLSEANVATLLRRYMPELKESAVQKLAKLAGGSIGRAMRYAENDAIDVYERIRKVCYSGEKCDGETLVELATEVAVDEDSWRLFAELICHFAREGLAEVQDMRAFYQAYENALRILNEVERVNMDKKQAVLQILGAFCKIKA